MRLGKAVAGVAADQSIAVGGPFIRRDPRLLERMAQAGPEVPRTAGIAQRGPEAKRGNPGERLFICGLLGVHIVPTEIQVEVLLLCVMEMKGDLGLTAVEKCISGDELIDWQATVV